MKPLFSIVGDEQLEDRLERVAEHLKRAEREMGEAEVDAALTHEAIHSAAKVSRKAIRQELKFVLRLLRILKE